MKIGFDVSQTGSGKAGCGFFADNLIKAIANLDKQNEYLLYRTFGNAFWDPAYKKTTSIKQNNFKLAPHHTSYQKAQEFWSDVKLSKQKQLGLVDILHTNNFFCPPTLSDMKIVYTLYDLSFMRYPEYSTEANRLVCFEGVLKASLHAAHIIAISEYSKQHFLSMFPYFDENKITVSYPASRFASISGLADQPARLSQLSHQNFWLNVGTIEPRKNQIGLLKAYAKYKDQVSDPLPLVFAGGRGWLMDSFEKAVQELNLTNHVILLGYVDETELLWLYQNCFALAYPSFFEGFGMPVLEAMTMGAPVITSKSSSLPEITGHDNLLVDPFETDTIADAMLFLAKDSNAYQQLKQKNMQQAQRFNWQKSAAHVLEVYSALGFD